MVVQGTFREDLYYRLSTFPIHLPALRERREDLAILSAALLKRMSPTRELGLSAAAQRLLQEQEFPGNVRELRNLLERTALLCDGDTLGIRHLERALLASVRPQASKVKAGTALLNTPSAAQEQRRGVSKLKEAERVAFTKLVEGYAGDRAELAQHLGISARSLYRKLKSLK
jgi:DNA-binding NtrC family response regulator